MYISIYQKKTNRYKMSNLSNPNNITPQKGFQVDFVRSTTQITLGGGGAGGGKTHALLTDTIYNISNPKFYEVFFRRTTPQITNAGGLWDASYKIYPHVKGKPNRTQLKWNFPSGASTKFSHLQYEDDIYNWQGTEITSLKFDELTHFSEKMFFYLMSRNRSTSGINPYIKATCNPDPFSFVADMVDWWLDPTDKLPDPAKYGKIRFFYKHSDTYFWGNTKKEVYEQARDKINEVVEKSGNILTAGNLIKSFTFLHGSIYQNKKLLESNIEYLSNLASLDEESRLQLLEGSWKKGTDNTAMIGYDHLLNSFSNEFVADGKKYITADIAMKGNDLFVVGVWNGFKLIDIHVEDISNGKSIIHNIKRLCMQYKVPTSSVFYDADGVGGFVDGFILNANEFHSGARALYNENYSNLKTQCYYKLADIINKDELYISEIVAEKIIKGKKIKDIIIKERKAIKRANIDMDGRKCIIRKEEMKGIIGHSPDFFDMICMRVYAEILPKLHAC